MHWTRAWTKVAEHPIRLFYKLSELGQQTSRVVEVSMHQTALVGLLGPNLEAASRIAIWAARSPVVVTVAVVLVRLG